VFMKEREECSDGKRAGSKVMGGHISYVLVILNNSIVEL
jgi:hypothetical protein